MVTVTFQGGPWSGRSKEYQKDPRVVACATDASAKGMHGVYRTRHGADGILAIWKEAKHDSHAEQGAV